GLLLVKLQRSFQLLDRNVDRLNCFDAMATEVVIGMLQLPFGLAKLADSCANVRVSLFFLGLACPRADSAGGQERRNAHQEASQYTSTIVIEMLIHWISPVKRRTDFYGTTINTTPAMKLSLARCAQQTSQDLYSFA